MSHRRCRLRCEQLEDRSVPTVGFTFNFSLDSNHFFDDTARRDLLKRAAVMITANLTDTLAAITPSGSNTWSASITDPGTGQSYSLNRSVPADRIVVYAGGRNLSNGTLGIGGSGGYSASGSTAWLNTVTGRGQPGALLDPATDVAPKIGSITFDTVGTAWHFGKTTLGLDSNESDFLSVAMHELGHVLGLSHLPEGTMSPEGTEAAMDPTLTNGQRKFFGKADFDALEDIGWQLASTNDTTYRAKDTLSLPFSSGGITDSAATAFNGRIDPSKDVDMYRIFANASDVLRVTVSKKTGGQNLDTYIRLFDSAGVQLKSADQGGVGGTDSMTFTLPRRDYYFVAVSSYGNRTYNPESLNSGPGGTLGDYRITIGLN